MIWENKTDDGSIHDKDNTYNWQNAQSVFIVNLNSSRFGGFSDWRLPTVKELSSIVNRGLYSPAIYTAFFPNTNSAIYWSSTRHAYYSTNHPWSVYYNDGTVGTSYNIYTNNVRAVRGIQVTNNFINNGDGTTTDNSTGLRWQQDGNRKMTWQDALSYCENLTLAGFDDWRLPNVNELQSMVDYNRYGPSFDPTYFQVGSVFYYTWSSTTNVYSPNKAWYIDFYMYGGGISSDYKSSSDYCVRCVRGEMSDSFGDLDDDGILDNIDNCPYVYNPDQTNSDGDSRGDACDNCPFIDNENQADSDMDGIGDVCDRCPQDPLNDIDNDGVCGNIDNCPNIYNPDQADSDGDGIGDECDVDYLRIALQECREQLNITTTTTTVPPTLIEMSSLKAIPSNEKVKLEWQTESETDNAGFNVWRAEGFIKISPSLISSQGSPTFGAEYDFVDDLVFNGKQYFYLIEDIDNGGISTFHGPVSATPRLIFGIGK